MKKRQLRKSDVDARNLTGEFVLGIIGGTGFGDFAGLSKIHAEMINTPFGEAYIEQGELAGESLIFIPRHGHPPQFPPHKINYRANIAALAQIGVDRILAITAVGSVDPRLAPGALVLPDQLIDYTWGREHTFFDAELEHIEFSYPYTQALRQQVIDATQRLIARAKDGAPRFDFHSRGVYGCSQGPRLETAAEIDRMARDGCTIVGMTAMPEAALAREKALDYAGLSLVVNAGAGINDQLIDLGGIHAVMSAGMRQVREILHEVVNPT
ncbi:MAG: 5'-methylthioinosine phosphorylase [Candidatus Azotimanducaceae bacterium]